MAPERCSKTASEISGSCRDSGSTCRGSYESGRGGRGRETAGGGGRGGAEARKGGGRQEPGRDARVGRQEGIGEGEGKSQEGSGQEGRGEEDRRRGGVQEMREGERAGYRRKYNSCELVGQGTTTTIFRNLHVFSDLYVLYDQFSKSQR